ncbi:tyrosine--tRNA ligase, mitochondrial [Culicoides brevitarsis]|uniref:tyrosine--tRNA ligase, mitochondrial n=1 Tax=Culicoides brevitarsis TaxID=469753 RepID=UPI00307B2927
MINRRIVPLRSLLKTFHRTYHNEGNILKLADRGFFQDIFPAEYVNKAKKLLTSGPQHIYAGFDPTADSLHIGNLLVLVGLLHCQRSGHIPIALLGGATGQVGDPSGRKTERNVLEQDRLHHNLACIRQQVSRIFENHNEIFWQGQEKEELKPVIIVNNADWYKKINSIEFVTRIGRYFRMGEMLSRSSVQSRLNSDSGMSFTEFTYQICQAYDWLHLYETYKCRFQLGGSDQMGNINSGHDLISKKEKKQAFGITLPLITNESGDKFGKSAGEAVWLDENKTSAYSLYQFFVRQPDSEVEKLLKLFTFLPMNEVEEMLKRHKRTPELREPQNKIADDVTLLIHGREGLKKAKEVSSALFKGDATILGTLPTNEIKDIFKGAPVVDILLEPGMTVFDLVTRVKCFPTDRDASRIISAGGFYINQKKVTNISEVICPGIHIMRNGLSLLRVGKRNYYIVKFLT